MPYEVMEPWLAGAALLIAVGAGWLVVRHESRCAERDKNIWDRMDKHNDKLGGLSEDVSEVKADVSYIKGRMDEKERESK